MLVILLGVECQCLLGELALGPGAVEGVLEQVIFFNERIERTEQRLAFLASLGHPNLLNYPDIFCGKQNHEILSNSSLKSQFGSWSEVILTLPSQRRFLRFLAPWADREH